MTIAHPVGSFIRTCMYFINVINEPAGGRPGDEFSNSARLWPKPSTPAPFLRDIHHGLPPQYFENHPSRRGGDGDFSLFSFLAVTARRYKMQGSGKHANGRGKTERLSVFLIDTVPHRVLFRTMPAVMVHDMRAVSPLDVVADLFRFSKNYTVWQTSPVGGALQIIKNPSRWNRPDSGWKRVQSVDKICLKRTLPLPQQLLSCK